MDLLGREPHGVEIGAMGSALRTLRHVTAGQSLLDVSLGVHRDLLPGQRNAALENQIPCEKGFSFALREHHWPPTYAKIIS
jgi:hypothetical protein